MSPYSFRARLAQRKISHSASAVVELMEQRKLLSSSLVNGVLSVTGTNGNDVVYIYYTGYQTQCWAVKLNGVTEFSTPTNTVTSFNVFTGSGNDSASIDPILWAPPATLSGGDGNDTLFGTDDADSLDGGAGTDSLVGYDGDDTLIGGTENDYFTGGDGNDSCDGGDGADYFWADFGDDTYVGGLGSDIMDYTSCFDPLNLSLDDVANDGGANIGYHDNLTSSLETILGGTSNDTISGEGGSNFIQGGNGNDFITGVGGNDSLSGNAGNDTISGGSGNDSIYGQTGNDSLLGDSGQDYLEGNAGQDYLLGGSDNDTLHGADGDKDTIDGAGGVDSAWRDLAYDTVTSIEDFRN